MNRMATYTQSSSNASYYYNALGQRMKKVVNGSSSYFVYGQGGQLQSEGSSRDYIYFNGAPVGLIRNGTLYYIHNDHLDRAERITNINEVTVWKASNFAFDRTVTQNSIGGYNLGFPGQYWDTEKGSWYNYFRDYDSATGRYLQSDPIGLVGGMNTYGYVGGNPIMFFDPQGGIAVSIIAGVKCAIGGYSGYSIGTDLQGVAQTYMDGMKSPPCQTEGQTPENSNLGHNAKLTLDVLADGSGLGASLLTGGFGMLATSSRALGTSGGIGLGCGFLGMIIGAKPPQSTWLEYGNFFYNVYNKTSQ